MPPISSSGIGVDWSVFRMCQNAGELAQPLRAALPEDLGFIPSTHKAAHKHLEFQFQGIQCLFWPLWVLGTHIAHRYI